MIVPPFHGWMTGPPPPIKKIKKISLSPSPQNPKKGKNWLHWLHTEPSSVPAWYFYYGPIPLHNKMDTYCAINRAEWAIPWNSGVLQFKKGRRLPPFFTLYVCSAGQTGVHRARWAGQTGRGTSPNPPSQIDGPTPGVGTFQARCDLFRDLVSISYESKSKTLQNPHHRQTETLQNPGHRQANKWINI
jgi:hypothetical protein